MTVHMRSVSLTRFFCALFAVGVWGCGGGDAPEADVNELTRAANEMQEAVEQMAAGETADPVDFRELKEILPEEVNGWQRIEHEGQRSGAAGFTVSTASALYQPDDQRFTTISIEIVDTGGLGSLATMGMAHWLSMEVEREDDNGYERTREYEGHPAYETFVAREGEIGSANLSLVVERRFIVQVRGADVTMEDVIGAANELDLGRLADLAKQ